MDKLRIAESHVFLDDEAVTQRYADLSEGMMDQSFYNGSDIIEAGICCGHAMEIGPGPGYFGLEWLKLTTGTLLTGCELSPEMICLAQKNAKDYALEERTNYVQGNCMMMPFADNTFDAVFSNYSLHEWDDPVPAFNEVYRVLKNGGRWYIADLRRDVDEQLVKLVSSRIEQEENVPLFLESLNSAYTVDEVKALLNQSQLKDAKVEPTVFGLTISGVK